MFSSIIISALYIAAQMISDIASLQIIVVLGFTMDAGTLIYPITFTLRDVAHKVLGLQGVRLLVVIAGGINLFMAAFFWLVSRLPPDIAAGSSGVWGQVLAPVWRITFASIIAEIISELTDTEIYKLWVIKITTRFQWMRVLASNAISIPLDTLVFTGLAFYGIMPVSSVWSIFWTNILLKGLVTILSLPMIYLVKEKGV